MTVPSSLRGYGASGSSGPTIVGRFDRETGAIGASRGILRFVLEVNNEDGGMIRRSIKAEEKECSRSGGCAMVIIEVQGRIIAG